MFNEEKDPSDEQSGSDGSDNSSDEQDSSEGQKTEPKTNENLFFNPNELPPELQGAFKKMQASYTRKMQEAGRTVRKARAFDELTANPEFQRWLDGQRDDTPAKGRGKSDDDGEETPSKGLDPKTLESIVDKVVSNRLAPIVRGEHRKQAQAEWDALIEKFPQADNYKDEIAEAMEEQSGLTYAKAFKLVAFDDVAEAKSKSSAKSKKEANTGSPSKINPGEKPPAKAKTIHEAAELARKQIRERK